MIGTDRHLLQTATVWPTTPSGYGGYNFGTPFTVKCRWEDRAERYFGKPTGKEEVSRAVIFVNQDLSIDDWIAEGDHTSSSDPSIVPGAYPIRDFSKIPDLRSLTNTRKVRV